MRNLIFILLASLFLTSCGEDTAAIEKAAMEAAQAAQQSAYDAMMEGHDRVMPLMGQITAAQKSVVGQMEMDGIDEGKKALLEAANEQLEDANDGMMKWMQGLKPLDELRANMDNDAIITYIKEQAAQIGSVETAMTAAIGAANELVSDHAHDGTEGTDHQH